MTLDRGSAPDGGTPARSQTPPVLVDGSSVHEPHLLVADCRWAPISTPSMPLPPGTAWRLVRYTARHSGAARGSPPSLPQHSGSGSIQPLTRCPTRAPTPTCTAPATRSPQEHQP